MNYAKNTTVSVDRSRAEIERLVMRYGATGFIYGAEEKRAVIAFKIGIYQVRIALFLPSVVRFMETPTGQKRAPSAAAKVHEQAIRQRWRSLKLIIQAKFEAVDCGISTIEREFLADVLLPSGETFGDRFIPEIEAVVAGRGLPQLLPGGDDHHA